MLYHFYMTASEALDRLRTEECFRLADILEITGLDQDRFRQWVKRGIFRFLPNHQSGSWRRYTIKDAVTIKIMVYLIDDLGVSPALSSEYCLGLVDHAMASIAKAQRGKPGVDELIVFYPNTGDAFFLEPTQSVQDLLGYLPLHPCFFCTSTGSLWSHVINPVLDWYESRPSTATSEQGPKLQRMAVV